ncbi:MAG: hypothetical protein NVSMB65_21820 [Chloroflexota bacterium]
MVRRTGQMGVPVTVLDGEAVIGFDRPRLEALIAARARNATPRPPSTPVGAAVKAVPGGVLVGRVRPESPAEASGLRAGDMIMAVDGHAVADAGTFAAAFEAATAGTPLAVQRDGREVMLRITRR